MDTEFDRTPAKSAYRSLSPFANAQNKEEVRLVPVWPVHVLEGEAQERALACGRMAAVPRRLSVAATDAIWEVLSEAPEGDADFVGGVARRLSMSADDVDCISAAILARRERMLPVFRLQ